jgi:hypothetical protein
MPQQGQRHNRHGSTHGTQPTSEEKLCLRHCGYWLSLAGQPDTENTTTVTVHLPRQQRFDSEALDMLMTRAERGEPL